MKEHKHKYSEYHASLLRWKGGRLSEEAKSSDHRLGRALTDDKSIKRRIFGHQ